MSHELGNVIGQLVRNYRHLMTEAERRADRAFVFQRSGQMAADAVEAARFTAATRQALADPEAAALFEKGRDRFLEDVAGRILAEHPEELPRCVQCGAHLKTPNPKQCFDCDYDSQAKVM